MCVRGLKVVASANALPSLGGGLREGPRSPPPVPHFLRTLIRQGGGIFFSSAAVSDIFLTQGPTPDTVNTAWTDGGDQEGWGGSPGGCERNLISSWAGQKPGKKASGPPIWLGGCTFPQRGKTPFQGFHALHSL